MPPWRASVTDLGLGPRGGASGEKLSGEGCGRPGGQEEPLTIPEAGRAIRGPTSEIFRWAGREVKVIPEKVRRPQEPGAGPSACPAGAALATLRREDLCPSGPRPGNG